MVDSLSILSESIKQVRTERLKWSERLANGGVEAPWSTKSSAQIDVNITTTNKIERLKGFEKGNNLLENRLKTQLTSIDDFMKLAKDIRNEFMPGSYTLGGVKPGFEASQQAFKNRFQSIGNRIDSISGEYAMGGVATQNKPIRDVATFVAYTDAYNINTVPVAGLTGTPADYGNPVNGKITVYINDSGDTVSLSGNDFDAEIGELYKALMQLNFSQTGCDAAADAASATAANAHQSLLTKYYQKLEQLKAVNNEDEQLAGLIQKAIELREEFTEDSIESLLSKVTTLSVMEDIRQHLFAQESRKTQNAAAMLSRG